MTSDLKARLSTLVSDLYETVPGDTDRLRALRQWRDLLDDELTAHVAVARERGLSWEGVGQSLRVTRQAAQQRYGG